MLIVSVKLLNSLVVQVKKKITHRVLVSAFEVTSCGAVEVLLPFLRTLQLSSGSMGRQEDDAGQYVAEI